MTLTNVAITDPKAAPITPGAVTLTPGQAQTFTGSYPITQADINAGSVSNDATVTGTPPSGPAVTDTARDTVTLGAAPSITVTKTRTSEPTVTVGELVTWRIVVKNEGNATSGDVTIEDSWTAGAFTDVTATPVPATLVDGRATFDLGTLAPHATRTIDITMTAAAVGRQTNAAASITEPSNTSIADVLVGAPRLVVTKTRTTDATIAPDAEVTWRIDVYNAGDTTATPVTLEDSWTAGALTFVSSTLPPNNVPTSNVASFTLPAIAPDTTATVSITTKAEAYRGTATNVAVAMTPKHPDPAGDIDTVLIGESEILVSKSLRTTGDVIVGDPVAYRITVSNVGNLESPSVTIEDSWTAGAFSFVSSNPAHNWVEPDGNRMTVILGAIEPAGQRTIDVTLTALAAGTQWNSAYSVTTPSTTGKVDVEVGEAVSALDITKKLKSAETSPVAVTEVATYTVTVTNSGNTRITAAKIVDWWDAAFASFSGITASDYTLGTGVTTVTVPVTLEPNDEYSFDIGLRIATRPESRVATNHASTADVRDHLDRPVDTAQAFATVGVLDAAAGIKVTKRYAEGYGQDVVVGQPIEFVLSVENTGSTAVDVTLTDTWNKAFLDWTGTSGSPSTLTSESVTFRKNGLAPRDTFSVTVRYLAVGTGVTENRLSVTGVDEYGDPVSGTDDAPVRVLPAVPPQLSLTKRLVATQDPFVQVGGVARYEIVVRNDGATTITAGTLVDTWDPAHLQFALASPAPLPPGAVGGTAAFGLPVPLAPSATTTYTLTFNVEGRSASGLVYNTARISNAVDEFDTRVNQVQDSESLRVTAPGVAVTKTLAPWQLPTAAVGEPVAFRITVTNSGDTTLPAVPLRDTYDGAVLAFSGASVPPASASGGTLVWNSLGQLAPGASATIDTTFTVTTVPAAKSTTNVATANPGTDVNGDPVAQASASSAIALVTPKVSVEKRLAPGQPSTVLFGETVSFDVVVTNTGDTTLGTVPLTDTFPAGLAFGGASLAPDSVAGATLTWNDITTALGDIPPGSSKTLRLNFSARDVAGTMTNSVAVRGARDLANRLVKDAESQATVVVTGPAVPVLVKSATPAPETIMMPGDTITYRLSFENTTSVDIPNAVIRDVVPVEARYQLGSLELDYLGTTKSLTDEADSDAGSYTSSSRTVAVNVGTLKAGTRGTVTFSVTIERAEISRPGVFNTFTLRSVDATPFVSNTIRHPVDPFDITKTAEDLNGGRLMPGDEILWTIRVVNTGLVRTIDVVVTDNIPAEVTYVRGSITGRGADDSNPRSLMWRVGSLPVGGEVTLTFLTTVNSGLAPGTEIRNVATVRAAGVPEKSSDDPDTQAAGDPTMARTGDNDWIWLLSALALLLAGAFALGRSSRRRIDEAGLTFRARDRVAVERRVLARFAGVALLVAALVVGLWANVDEVQYRVGLADSLTMWAPPASLGGAQAAVAAPEGGVRAFDAARSTRSGGANRVAIPEIGVDIPIGENEKSALARGAWHQPGSATPDSEGNMVLAGHRRRGVFGLLRHLAPGDEIVVTWEGQTYRYRVTSRRTVKPAERTVIMREGEDRLTLYTCIPRFLGDKRVVVTAVPTGQ